MLLSVAVVPSCYWMYHSLFLIPQFMNILSSFQFLVIMNKATVVALHTFFRCVGAPTYLL